jgi:hypothetical protein
VVGFYVTMKIADIEVSPMLAALLGWCSLAPTDGSAISQRKALLNLVERTQFA